MSEPHPNPLASNRRLSAPPEPQEHPMMAHARMAQMAHGMPPENVPGVMDFISYATPVIGALAGDSKVTSKDVIKAAAQAVADGKMPASKAVQFISSMPADPDALRPWLKNLYASNMTALVHLKAAMMKNAPAAAPVAAPGPVAPVAAPAGPAPGAAP